MAKVARALAVNAVGFNLGDDAIFLASRTAFERHGVHLDSTSMAPLRTAETIGYREAIRTGKRNIPGFVTAVARHDAVVLGGGSLVQDELGQTLTRGLLSYAAFGALASRVTRTPLFGLALGAECLRSSVGRRYARFALRSLALATVRDPASAERIRSLAPDLRVVEAADPAWLLDAPRVHGEDVAVVSLAGEGWDRREFLVRGVADAIANLQRNGLKVRIVCMDSRANEDQAAAQSVAALLPDGVEIWHPAGPLDALSCIARARVAFGMRYHFLLFAALARVPVLALGRTGKTESLARQSDLAHVDLRQCGDAGTLTRLINAGLERSKVAGRVDELRELASRGIDHIAEAVQTRT